MTDMRLAVIVTGDGSGLKAVMRSAAGDVKAFGDAAEAASAKSVAAAAKSETAWMRTGTTIERSLSGVSGSAAKLGSSLEQIFGRMSATFGRLGEGLSKAFSGVASSFGRMGPMFQQAGYQVGDFFVQLESGQGIMRPLIQQGSQFISMFGPWGAVIGAAGAAVGALAMAFSGLQEETLKAEAAQEAMSKALERAKGLQKELTNEVEATTRSRQAELRVNLQTQVFELQRMQGELAKIPKTVALGVGEGFAPGADEAINTDWVKKSAEVDAFSKTVDELRQSTRLALGEFNSYSMEVFGSGGGGVTTAVTEMSKGAEAELQKLMASLRQDAELAGLSGMKHAERQAILQAEAAAQRDFENKLRSSAELTDAERASVIAAADARYTNADAIKRADEAARQAQQTTQQQQKAIEDATKAINDQIAGYDEELYQLNLSDRERYIRQGLLQAEQTATKANTVVTLEQAEAIRQERGAIFDRNTAIADGKKAQQEATQEAERASRDREKIAEREAELQLQPYKNAIQGLQTAWTDGWYNALSGNINTFGEFFSSVKQMGIRWAAEMVSLMTFRPVASSIIGSVAPQLAASLGLGSAGLSGQNAAAAASAAGGLGSFAVSSAPLAALFGGAGGATSGLGSWLFGAGSPVMSNGIQVGTSGGGLLGSLPGLAGFLNSGLGTGLVGGLLSAGLTYASGGSALQAGISGGGSLLGGLAGSIFGQPVLGAALGGIAGNIISSLFGGKDKKPPKQQSITSIETLANGLFGVTDTTTKHSADMTSGIAGDAANTLNTLLASLRASITGAMTGQLLYYGRTPRPMSSVGGVINQFDDSEQGAKDAVADFVARTMVEAAKSDKLKGVTPAVAKAIAESGAKDAEALDAAIAFGKFFDRVDKIRTPADAAAAAIADLSAQMTKATSQAEQYGLDIAKLPEIFKENFIEDIEQQILALTDPQAAALNEEEKNAAARIAQAELLGADLAKVEELNALKRQQVLEQGLQGMSSTLQDFFNGLTTGPLAALSPQEQLRQATLNYENAYQSGDSSAFTQAASTLLTIARDFYASSQGYADIYRQVLQDTKDLGKLSNNLPRGLSTVGSTFGRDGDKHLVHVNDNELEALYAMGGAGTVNPDTGLLEFHGGGMNGGASGRGNDRASGRSGSSGGSKAATGHQAAITQASTGQNMTNAGNGSKSTNTGGGNSGVNLAGPNPGDMASGGIVGPNGYLGMGGVAGFQGSAADESISSATEKGWAPFGSDRWNEQQQAVMDALAAGATPSQVLAAGEALSSRLRDWTDTDNTFGEDVANFFASWLGFNETMPTFDMANLNWNADWSWDPAGLIGGTIFSALTGLPIIGGVVSDFISARLGRPLAIDLGPSVVGEPDIPSPANENTLNDSLNTQRAAALSAVQSSTFSGLGGGGTFADPSHLPSGVDARLASSVAQQSQRIAQLEGSGQATARTNQEMLSVLKEIRNSQTSTQYWQTLTAVRKKAS